MSDGDPLDPDAAEVERRAAERLTFFSDAVVAIALTLLALELPAPEGRTTSEVLRSLADHGYEYSSFLIGFLVVAAHWNAHHRVFRWLTGVRPRLVTLSLTWLLLIVLTPFLTRVLTEGDLDTVRFGMFAVAQALLQLVFAAMVSLAAREGLFAAAAPAAATGHPWRHAAPGALGFLVAVPLFPLVGRWAFVLWAAVPVLYGRLVARRLPD
ncbi:TMEM175 family protein [Geodermatophilus amargosae]|uniref:TMEM175 family protein n=1 Tax=Geodermatophilus amargosae TaxID=1296565 RepID=UPI0034DEC77D